MPTIRNPLLLLSSDEIANLLKNHRQDKATELYDKVLRFPQEYILFDDDFLGLVYKTIETFDMKRGSVKLVEQSSFKGTLRKYAHTIQSLAAYRIETINDADGKLMDTISFLFDNLELVQGDAPLVTFSKTMHFLLPDLFMPIDRKYTIQYFYREPPYKRENYDLPHVMGTREKQKERLFEVFEQFRLIFHKHGAVLSVNSISQWNRNIPKVIDNVVMTFVKENMEPAS